MAQNPHTNPRFRKPATRVQFRLSKDLSIALDKACLDAIPNYDGELPKRPDVARALIEQSAKHLTGRVAWLKAAGPTKEQIKLAEKAGYELVTTGISSDKMDIDFDKIDQNFASVMPVHPWHVIQSHLRGLSILMFEGSEVLYIFHASGLVRKFTL